MTSSKDTIFIVEDESFLVKTYIRRLKKIGVTPVVAKDGEEALKKISDLSADLILLDLILPKKNGFDVLKAIKENKKTKDVPVLILSNLGSDRDIEYAKELGAEEYFVKADTSLDTIMQKIRDYIT